MARTNAYGPEVVAGILPTPVVIVETEVAILDAAAEIVMTTEIGAETELMLEIRIGLQDGTAETVTIDADATAETPRIDGGVTAGTENGVLEIIGIEIRAVTEIYPATLVMIEEAIGIEIWAGTLVIAAEPHHDAISRPQKRRSRKQLSNVSLRLKPTWRPNKKPEKRASRFLDSTNLSRMGSHDQIGAVVMSFQILASEMQTLRAWARQASQGRGSRASEARRGHQASGVTEAPLSSRVGVPS